MIILFRDVNLDKFVGFLLSIIKSCDQVLGPYNFLRFGGVVGDCLGERGEDEILLGVTLVEGVERA